MGDIQGCSLVVAMVQDSQFGFICIIFAPLKKQVSISIKTIKLKDEVGMAG